MDRPEWIAVHPTTSEVYCTLTNNSQRGRRRAAGDRRRQPAGRATSSATSSAGARTATTRRPLAFRWNIFVLAGDPRQRRRRPSAATSRATPSARPDGLWFDDRGVLWIQTDISTSALNTGDYANIGNNHDAGRRPATGEIRRFLTGPRGCEVTGVIDDARRAHDVRQHPAPGRAAERAQRSREADGGAMARQRHPAAIGDHRGRRKDGGVIGTYRAAWGGFDPWEWGSASPIQQDDARGRHQAPPGRRSAARPLRAALGRDFSPQLRSPRWPSPPGPPRWERRHAPVFGTGPSCASTIAVARAHAKG